MEDIRYQGKLWTLADENRAPDKDFGGQQPKLPRETSDVPSTAYSVSA